MRRGEMLSITGLKIVREFIRSERQRIFEICILGEFRRQVADTLSTAERRGITIRVVSSGEMMAVHDGQVKNGIVARIDGFNYGEIDEVTGEESGTTLLVMLDRVFDPQNLGAIARSAYCFGATAVLLQEKRAPSITAAAVHASAGALAHIPVIKVVNLAKTADRLKGKGFWVYGTAPALSGVDMEEVDPPDKALIILGSEGEGIRKKLLEKCDFTVSIPVSSRFDSLNVSVAAGIILYTFQKKILGVGKGNNH